MENDRRSQELHVVIAFRKVITLMLVTDEMTRREPDFENDSLTRSVADLKRLRMELAGLTVDNRQ